jgi:hypothetical protein
MSVSLAASVALFYEQLIIIITMSVCSIGGKKAQEVITLPVENLAQCHFFPSEVLQSWVTNLRA